MNFTKKLTMSDDSTAKCMYSKYMNMFESPHAEVHDAHNHSLLLDMFQEKDGEIRPDKQKHDWIEYLGSLLNGESVTDFYGQHFNLDTSDIEIIEDELIKYYQILADLVKIEIDHSPWKAKYLPFRFLKKLYATPSQSSNPEH